MNRRVSTVSVLVLALALGACASKAATNPRASASTANTASTSVPAASPTTPQPSATTTTVAVATGVKKLPIATSRVLSSSGQDPSVLNPVSCTVSGGVLTAKGTFNYEAEETIRFGDVVELYAYGARTAIDRNENYQVADLASEHPFPIAGKAPWTVTVPVDPQLHAPAECLVAVQSTHAFMGGGDAGG